MVDGTAHFGKVSEDMWNLSHRQTVELVTQVFEMVEMITISFFESVELAIIL